MLSALQRLRRTATLCVALLAAATAPAAEHPPLAGMEDTPCAACHEVTDAPVVHGPAAGDCSLCHRMEVGEGGTAVTLTAAEPELCLRCHAALAPAVAGDTAVPHPALDMLACTGCHDPHGAERLHLLRRAAGEECRDCHDDRFPGEGETAHGVVTLVGCHACHRPHGGETAHLLRAAGPDLCLACHAPAAAGLVAPEGTLTLLGAVLPAQAVRRGALVDLSGDRGHPVAGHRTLGAPTPGELQRTDTTFTGALTCLSCHDPHKGRAHLLTGGAATATRACAACHPKV